MPSSYLEIGSVNFLFFLSSFLSSPSLFRNRTFMPRFQESIFLVFYHFLFFVFCSSLSLNFLNPLFDRSFYQDLFILSKLLLFFLLLPFLLSIFLWGSDHHTEGNSCSSLDSTCQFLHWKINREFWNSATFDSSTSQFSETSSNPSYDTLEISRRLNLHILIYPLWLDL